MNKCSFKIGQESCEAKAGNTKYCKRHELADSGTSKEIIEYHLTQHEEAGTLTSELLRRFERSLNWINSGHQSKYESLVDLKNNVDKQYREPYIKAIAESKTW